jgi:hypothetical protein
MRNGRFHSSKCRGKVQKMGVLYTHSPKMLGPSPNFLITPKIKSNQIKKIAKKERRQGAACSLSNYMAGPVGDHWLPVSPTRVPYTPPLQNFPSYVHVVNSCWLATAHAHLAQTSPKNFKHP